MSDIDPHIENTFIDISIAKAALSIRNDEFLDAIGYLGLASDCYPNNDELRKYFLSALVAALRNDQSAVRKRAVKTLGEIGNSAAPALVIALQNEDIFVQESAAKALESIGKQAIPALIEAFRHAGRRAVTTDNDRAVGFFALSEIWRRENPAEKQLADIWEKGIHSREATG